ncbi:hypothetical protein Tco_1163525 [Tanacetum coccineum]
MKTFNLFVVMPVMMMVVTTVTVSAADPPAQAPTSTSTSDLSPLSSLLLLHRSLHLSSESASFKKFLRCWFGSSDRSPWNERPFCTNRMVSDRRVTPSDIQHSAAYTDLGVLQIGIRAKVIENQSLLGADDDEVSEGGFTESSYWDTKDSDTAIAPPSSWITTRPRDPQGHNSSLGRVSSEEQPLPSVDSPTRGHSGYVMSRIRGDRRNDEDEDDEEEEEEHLAPADSAIVVPVDEPVFPPEGTKPASYPVPRAGLRDLWLMTTPSHHHLSSLSPPLQERSLAACTAPTAHYHITYTSPLLPLSGWSNPNQTLRITSTHALIDEDDIPESNQLPAKREATGIRDVGYGIRDTWVDPVEAVPEITPMTVGELIRYDSLRDRFTYGDRMESPGDSMDGGGVRHMLSGEAWAHSIGIGGQANHSRASDISRQDQMVETLRFIRDMRREMSDMQAELLALREQQRRARQPGPEARIPDHHDAYGDADSHI